MIEAGELRLGNYILHKTGVRILPTKVSYAHFDLLAKGMAKEMFPVSLKPELVQKIGFIENLKYFQYPEAREFVLTLPIMGNNKHEILAYINSKKETYARVSVNDLVISNNFYNLHQLQNVYFALVGKEMEVQL